MYVQLKLFFFLVIDKVEKDYIFMGNQGKGEISHYLLSDGTRDFSRQEAKENLRQTHKQI